MNSVKFGQRGGRFKAVEDELIKHLIATKTCTVYVTEKIFIDNLIEDLQNELRVELGIEAIFDTKPLETESWLTFDVKVIGYKIFVK